MTPSSRTRKEAAANPYRFNVALDQYVALSPEHQHLIDSRLSQLLDKPDDGDCSYDELSDQWDPPAT
jgi:hypothetical protein